MGVLIALALFAAAITVAPTFFISGNTNLSAADRLRLENEVRGTLVQSLSGLLLAAGLVATYFTVGINTRSLEVNREGQITQRFSQAVAQLGDESVTIRLGGIYALERIARDSQRDHGPVVEILSAFLRDQAWKGDVLIDRPGGESAGEATFPARRSFASKRLRPDLQAAATVLGRRNLSHDYRGLWRLNLSQADLRYADLRSAHFEGATLWEADLERANLATVWLMGSDLAGASLREAWLIFARAQRAFFSEARLEGAHLTRSFLEGSKFLGTHLEGAIFDRSRLTGTSFSGALMEATDLRNVDLSGALDLSQAQMEAALTDATTVWPPYLKATSS